MTFKLSIAKKGLILALVPLVFELIFVLGLGVLLDQSRHKALELNQSRVFVSGISDLTKDFLDLGIALAAYRSTRGNRFVEQYDAIYARLPAKYEALEKANSDQPNRLKHLAKLKQTGKDLTELTQAFRRPTDSAMVYLLDPMAYRQKVSNAYASFMDETKEITIEEEQLQQRNPANEGSLRNALFLCIWLGVIASILITVLLLRFFALGITQRLTTLIDNYRRFGQKRLLLSPVGGDDEIADLDESFHAMAKKLTLAEERKKLYTQMISHDLRAPLAAIQGTLAVALKGLYGDLNDKGKKRIGAAEADSDRLINLINEMLDIDSMEDGRLELDKEPCQLEAILEGAINSVSTLAEAKQINIESKVYSHRSPAKGRATGGAYGGSDADLGDDFLIVADQERLKRVVINLLHNSIKFSPLKETIEINSTISEDTLKIMIKDRGPGIKPEEATKLFQPFSQGESGKKIDEAGSGLGLAICKAIVEAHGGKIGLESKVGYGSIFWFSIPTD
jgi:signal transduction histidine kinase